jgi:hypothetical protein
VAPEGTAQLVVAVPASRVHRFTRKGECWGKVFIRVDPHKLSVTIEVADDHEVVAGGRSIQHRQRRVRRDA